MEYLFKIIMIPETPITTVWEAGKCLFRGLAIRFTTRLKREKKLKYREGKIETK